MLKMNGSPSGRRKTKSWSLLRLKGRSWSEKRKIAIKVVDILETIRLKLLSMYENMDYKLKKTIRSTRAISKDFGRILSFVDFGNVNYWFEEDRQTHEYVALKDNEKLFIDIEKLSDFLGFFQRRSFYYSHDTINKNLFGLYRKPRVFLVKTVFLPKSGTKVRHYQIAKMIESEHADIAS